MTPRRMLVALLAAIIVLLTLALTIPVAYAAEPAVDNWLVVPLGSRHHKRGYNEHNWGLGLEYGLTENTRAVVGFYSNSFERQTIYAGGTYQPFRIWDWRVGGAAIFASGYERRPTFLPFPLISYEQKNWGLNIGPILPTVVGFQVKFRFD